MAGLAISPQEGPRHIGFQPVASGAEAAVGNGTDDIANGADHITDAVMRQLLRRRTLLMNEITLTFTAQHLDVIYAALQNGPYQQVAPVIKSIEMQVNAHNDGLAVPEPETEDANAEGE